MLGGERGREIIMCQTNCTLGSNLRTASHTRSPGWCVCVCVCVCQLNTVIYGMVFVCLDLYLAGKGVCLYLYLAGRGVCLCVHGILGMTFANIVHI